MTHELPPEQEAVLRKARWLEIVTLVYIVTAAIFLYATMGSSQAMRASFFEDVISSAPAIAFLVCVRIARRPPDAKFPYGRHAAVGIGYLIASLALMAMGVFLLAEAAHKLVTNQRTTIGGMQLFERTVWAGWPMFVALLYTAVPSAILGRIKMRLAPQLHDKILYADAKMMKADWMAETATAIGVAGVGFGLWWIDPLAGALVGADIFKDGLTNIRVAMHDLMERRPMKTDRSGPEDLPDILKEKIESFDWVEAARVRLRETGHVFYGEVFVRPRSGTQNLPRRVREAMADVRTLNWRLRDIVITPVDDLMLVEGAPREG